MIAWGHIAIKAAEGYAPKLRFLSDLQADEDDKLPTPAGQCEETQSLMSVHDAGLLHASAVAILDEAEGTIQRFDAWINGGNILS